MTTNASLRCNSESVFLEEDALAGVYVIQGGHLVLASPRLAKTFGYEVEELLGRPLQDLVAPESRDQVERQLARRLSGEQEAVHYAFRGVRKGGERIEVEVFGWRTEHEGAPAVRGILLDVSEHARAARALRQSEERFRALIENSRDLITSGRLPRVLYMSGYAAEAVPPEDAIETRSELLQKPFTPDALLRRVREALDRPSPKNATL